MWLSRVLQMITVSLRKATADGAAIFFIPATLPNRPAGKRTLSKITRIKANGERGINLPVYISTFMFRLTLGANRAS